MLNMTEENLDHLHSIWKEASYGLNWDCLFVLPPWLKAWWQAFGARWTPSLCVAREKETVIGIAPLMIQEDRASFMGDPQVCDYLDFVLASGREKDFFKVLITHLRRKGIARLDLRGQRPFSPALSHLVELAKTLNYNYSCYPDGVAYTVDLPPTWDDYLLNLSGKQRHEIRRKIKRLNEFAPSRLRVVEEVKELGEALDVFLALFRANRADKATFMSQQMEHFFRSLSKELAEEGILKIFFLDIEDRPAAAAICFDYQSTIYLYNNGYDKKFQPLNVGLLNKVFTIQRSILNGWSRYDFLKGQEVYKQRLGGKPLLLYRFSIAFC